MESATYVADFVLLGLPFVCFPLCDPTVTESDEPKVALAYLSRWLNVLRRRYVSIVEGQVLDPFAHLRVNHATVMLLVHLWVIAHNLARLVLGEQRNVGAVLTESPAEISGDAVDIYLVFPG